MATSSRSADAVTEAVAHLLEAPRYEVIPFNGIDEKIAALPAGCTVTVTASPAHGLLRTVELAEQLAARGHAVVPHLAARMIHDRDELLELAGRLAAAGVEEIFVVGGDATAPAGAYAGAGDLLEELAAIEHPFTRIGIGGYPEGHPLIDAEQLLAELHRKQPHATHIVSQLCFDADSLLDWLRELREEQVELPVIVGLPGVVERRKLAEISLKAGVGASLRYLRRHGRQLVAMSRSPRYDPTPLTQALGARLSEDDLGVVGAHLFTFNQIAETAAWVRSLGGGGLRQQGRH